MMRNFMVLALQVCLIVAIDVGYGNVGVQSYMVQDCNICLEPVYERTVENSTDMDNSVKNAISCGHFTELHTDCLLGLLVISSKKIGCPVCEQSLMLDGIIGDAVYSKRKQQFLETRLSDGQKDIFMKVLDRWPRILEIGNAKVACADMLSLKALDCAYHILQNPNIEEYLTSLMSRLANNRENTLKFLARNQECTSYYCLDAKVYDHFGEIISIQDAVIISLNSFIGEQVEHTLKTALGFLETIPRFDDSHLLLNLPEIRAIKDEDLFIDEMDTTCSILRATHIIKTPLLYTQAYEDGIHATSKAFIEAEDKVDEFLDEHYPHIAAFKNIKMWKDIYRKHRTIRYMAKMVINTQLPGDEYRQTLDRYEEGAIAAKLRFLTLSDMSYQGMQYLQNYTLENAPGGSITMRSAILYAMHPELSRDEDETWIKAINDRLTSILKTTRPFRSRVAGINENFNLHKKQREITSIQKAFNTELQRDFYSRVNHIIRTSRQTYDDRPVITVTA